MKKYIYLTAGIVVMLLIIILCYHENTLLIRLILYALALFFADKWKKEYHKLKK